MHKEDQSNWIFPVKEYFKLSDAFLEKYKDKQPNWGPLGYLTFKRTYARNVEGENRTEEWFETCKRVVEGCFTIQLNHCKNLKLPWDAWKSQKSAQDMYDRMFSFKWLPAGRGVYSCGTPVIYKRGSFGLFNCATITTKNIKQNFSDPFIFMMDVSMAGVGCGFSLEGANQVKIVKPIISDETFVVEDSAKGWCDCVKILLDSFVGKCKYPKNIDYSLIRPAGSPIVTSGGIAPGPQILIDCINSLYNFLTLKIDNLITSTDIVDIMNMIGKCVVSGGKRRTAQLALGSADDKEYLEMKDPTKFEKELKDFRWNSNNSVIGTIGMDYSKFVDQIATNGEPGIIYLDALKNYGRIKDGYQAGIDDQITSTNPCISGDTKVLTADGRMSVRIDEIEDGTPVFCLNNNGKLDIRPMRHPRITGYNSPTYKVIFDDGMEIICTNNHKFLTTNDEYVELKNLNIGDSLRIITKYIPDFRSESYADQYISYSYRRDSFKEHTLLGEYKYNCKKEKGFHINHKDGNKLNNSFDNLEMISEFDHLSEHSFGKNNPKYINISNEDLLNIGIELCKKLNRRFSDDEWQQYASENKLPKSFSSYRRNIFGNVPQFSKLCAVKAEVFTDESFNDIDPRIIRSYQKLVNDGYNPIIKNKELFVKKECEQCKKMFEIHFSKREQSICSKSCANIYLMKDPLIKEKIVQKRNKSGFITFENKRNVLKEKQLQIYSDLKFKLNREPMKKEWINQCREEKTSAEICRKGSPFKSWDLLKETHTTFNHKIVKIEFFKNQDVWNGTVDDYHNFFIGGHESTTPKGRNKLSYVNSTQCGEIGLSGGNGSGGELCNIAETFPSLHDNYEDFKKTLKCAYLYTKTVTLIPTSNEFTNTIILKNRRIGVSMSGIVDCIAKIGTRNFFNWCDNGYKHLKHLDKIYSDWLCIQKSIKLTTSKPAGSVSLLPGVSPGIHYPHSKYYIRRIRIDLHNPIMKAVKKAGYKIEESVYGDNTMVVEVPVKSDYFIKSKYDVSIWEQLELGAKIQELWSDNSVSQTVTFKKDEVKDLKMALELYEDRLKTVSFLPLDCDSYAQLPYETITEEQYLEMSKKIKPLNFKNMNTHDIESEEKFCEGDKCTLNFVKNKE